MADIALYCGDYDEALRRYGASAALYSEIGDLEGLPDCLQGLASVAAQRDQPEKAARLFGCEEALRATTGVVVPGPSRALREKVVAGLRERRGPAVFDAAWAFGRATPAQQLLAPAESVTAPEPAPIAPFPALAAIPTPPAPPAAAPVVPAHYPAGLTEREVAVLRLVALGLSNVPPSPSASPSVASPSVASPSAPTCARSIASWASPRALLPPASPSNTTLPSAT